MKRLTLLGLLLATACGSSKPAVTGGNGTPPPPPPPPPAEPQPYAASGDGAVVKLPIDGAVAVAIQLMFYTGSIDDPVGREGLTALTANLMAEGGTKSRTYPEMLKALYPMAASISVATDKEQVVFSTLAHTDHVDSIVPMLAEVVTAPRFETADFERIKKDMINDIEKRLRATDDENLGKEALNHMLYRGDHAYRHFVGGTVQGLKAITLDEVKAHAAKVFGKKRLVIGLGGAVTDDVEKKIQDALAALPDGAARVETIRKAPQPANIEVLIVEKPSAKAIAISMGYPHGSRRGHEDFVPLGLVQSYFGEHRQFHGVLMKQMRGVRGLNYGDYAYVENFVQEGWSRFARPNVARRRQHFEIWIRPVAIDDTVFSLRLAMYYLDRLVRDGLTSTDVTEVNQFLQGYTRLWEMTPSRRLGHALDDHFYGTSKWLTSYREGLAQLTADDVNAALRRHLVPAPIYIAIVAPDGEAMKNMIVNAAPTKKKYPAKKPDAVLKEDEIISTFDLGIDEANVRIVPVGQMFEK